MMTEEYKEEYKKARKAAMKQYRTCASRGWSLYPPVLDEVSAYVKTAGEEVLGRNGNTTFACDWDENCRQTECLQ